MPREKTVRRDTGSQEVTYEEHHWLLLSQLRQRAIVVMAVLEQTGIAPLIHGSICRGDVSEHSDVDVYIPQVVPSFSVVLWPS